MEGFGWYTYEISKRLVEQHPEHEFVFFFDRPFDKKFLFGPNVTPVVVSPPARHPILFIFWFEYALKKAMDKHKIDVLFSPDGYLSLRSSIPQIGVIHDINFEHFPKDLPFTARKYLQYYFPLFAKKAEHIITVSNYSKKDISETYAIPESKITAVWNGASDLFKPIPENEKEEVRMRYSDGKPYFLFVGALHPRKNVKRLIEAYVQFVARTDSEMQLVIVGESLWKKDSFQLNVDRNIEQKIHFTGHVALTDLSRIMAGATVFTYIPYFEGFGIPLVEAMKCGTPILAGNKTSLPEVAGEAALYCDPFNVNEISDKMELLIADRPLRMQLSKKGLDRSTSFNWDVSATKVWDIILSVSQK
jgi:glycosyltransferase involved in cell wall biosynthesis